MCVDSHIFTVISRQNIKPFVIGQFELTIIRLAFDSTSHLGQFSEHSFDNFFSVLGALYTKITIVKGLIFQQKKN